MALNGAHDIFAAKEYKGIQEMYNKLLPFISPELLHEEYTKKCIEAHNKFKGFKYKVNIGKGDNKRVIYTNKIDEYKHIKDKNVTILKYINYNNTIDKTVNMPFLKDVYYKDTVESIINEDNYKNYKTTYIHNGKISFYEYGFDGNNKDIYFKNNDYLSIHNDYGSTNYISIRKYKNSDIYYVHRRGNINYKTTSLDKEILDMLYKQLERLENNKNYNYNIQELKNILNIA